jgi:hypothetical protein
MHARHLPCECDLFGYYECEMNEKGYSRDVFKARNWETES